MRSQIVVSGQNAGAQQYDNLRHDARGGSFLLAHQMLGYISLPTNPSNTQTLTIDINGNNVVFTFVSAIGSTAGNVLIGASAAATVANLLSLLNQPQTTTSTGVALATANQQLLAYLTYSLPSGGTTLYFSSNNTSLYAPETSFSASTTATGGSWTAQTMQLYVEPGVVYVNGTRVIFTGGATSTVTAPSSHPRIDVLTIDNTGTLAWTTGTEASSPSAPSYPANKVALCELYNVVGETALYDNENQVSGQGYVYHDVRPIVGSQFNPSSVSSSIIASADATYDLGSSGDRWNNIYAASFRGDGSQLTGINSSITASMWTAAEAISAGQPVAIVNSPANLIGFDTNLHFVNSSTGGSNSFTVGNNSNRVLVVLFQNQNNNVTISNPQYGGVSMSLVDSANFSGSYFTYSYVLVAPATGTNNLTFTASGSANVDVYVYSFYNCAQSGQPDAHITTTSTSISITPNSTFTIAVGLAGTSGSAPSGSLIANGTLTGSFVNSTSGYSNLIQPYATSVSATGTGSTVPSVAVTLQAYMTTATYQAWKAGSANSAFTTYFAGFAYNSPSVGQSCTVVTAGVITGLSSLTQGSGYYLNDTRGTFGISPGTNTKKIGIAIEPTKLAVTNIW